MMIFYLDTTSSNLNFALYNDDNIVFSYSEFLGSEMSVKTLSTIKNFFDKYDIKLSSINKIIAVNGPGSFTGTRIGLTIAKTLAWSLNIPIITVSSLEVMALSYMGNKDYVIPMIDARRGYVFSGIYDLNNDRFYLKEQYINIDKLLNISRTLNNVDYLSNDKFELDLVLYSPNFLNIIRKVKDYQDINPHLVDANYLKLTEAEENLNNDKRN